MRIIAGKFRSRTLKMVPSESTRETSDKVRGAVFNSLSDSILNARVLDLFAGSGSYGIESISRGSKFTVFNDYKPIAVKTIKENLISLGVLDSVEVIQMDYQKAVTHLIDKNQLFDVIFLDPPYDFKNYEELIESLTLITINGSMICLEVHKDTKLTLNHSSAFSVYKEKTYGIKKIIYIINN